MLSMSKTHAPICFIKGFASMFNIFVPIYIYIDRCVFLSSVFVVHPAPSIWCESSGCDFSRFPETLELKIRNVRIPTSDGFKFSPVFPFFAKVNWQLVDQCHSDESSDVPFQGS